MGIRNLKYLELIFCRNFLSKGVVNSKTFNKLISHQILVSHTSMENLFAQAAIFLISTAKFSITSLAVIAAGLGIESALANVAGGIAGVLVFTYLGSAISRWVVKCYPEKYGKKFSWRTRFLVKVKKTFGLGGIALLTPVFLSIPVGVLFSLSFTPNRRKVFWGMTASCVLWSLVFFIPYFAFGFNVKTALSLVF